MRIEVKHIFEFKDGEISEDKRQHRLLASLDDLEMALHYINGLASELRNSEFRGSKYERKARIAIGDQIHEILKEYNIYTLLGE